jgi:cephalosporin hydroxylase
MDEDVLKVLRRYGESQIWRFDTKWLGRPALKCPLDLWIYQEIVFRTRPDLIIETGTAAGGSALFLATVCDLLDNGRIVTIDIEKQKRPRHDRITYLHGSSLDVNVKAEGRTMVILDSDHSKDHVLAELHKYAPLVSEGCYLIVEDTSVRLVLSDHGPGPAEAVEEFLKGNREFEIDRDCEKFLLTFNPGGYLRRTAGGESQLPTAPG